MPRRLRVRTALLLVLLTLLCTTAFGAPLDRPIPYTPPAIDLPVGHEKVSNDLLALVDDRFLPRNQSRAGIVTALSLSGHYARGGQRYRGLGTPAVDLVGVYIRTEPGSGTAPLRPFVGGIMGEDPGYGLVAAWVAPDRLLALAQLPSVREIRPVHRPQVRTGSVTTAGDTVHRAAALRQATGLSGAGIKVGVISNGVDSWRAARSSGDLPAEIEVLRNQIGGDEGTAMLEIVHDLAPNASLAFHDCGWSILEFNRAIDALADAGCTVIVDDIGWLEEPFFEDGIVAAHVRDVVRDRGVLFVSAAGNDADLHYQGQFRDGGGGWNDFSSGTDPSRKRLYVSLPPGSAVDVVLQWSEPFGAASSNYDLSLYDTADLSTPLATDALVQDGDGDPIEILTWTNDRYATVAAEIDVLKPSSAPGRILELFVYPRGSAEFLATNAVAADSIYGHPAANGAVAVAAIDASNPTAAGIEYYSSRGPVTIVSPGLEIRQKPEVSGLDGVRVTGAGGFSSPFWGTSASAPHAAGVAALVWSGRPTASAAEVRSSLLSSADDLGARGLDGTFGAGLLNATAMQTLLSPAVLSLPGAGREPNDLNGDGLYEDVNGNGRQDFADVVLYFHELDWVAANEPMAAFDFNRNGRVDFADIVLLFEQL